jgi:hypothetical protein
VTQLSQATAIDHKLREEVAAFASLQNKADKGAVRIARHLAEMYKLFEAKDPREKLLGFKNFAEWMRNRMKPIAGRSESRGWFLMSIGKHLVGKFPDEMLEEFGIEKCKTLARYAKQKREIPSRVVDMAKSMSSHEFEETVAVELSKGGDMHEGGPRARIELIGPRDTIRHVEKLLDDCRPYCGEGKHLPDHAIIEEALVKLHQEAEEAERLEQSRVSGVPAVDKETALLLVRAYLIDLPFDQDPFQSRRRDSQVKMIEYALALSREEIETQTDRLLKEAGTEHAV